MAHNRIFPVPALPDPPEPPPDVDALAVREIDETRRFLARHRLRLSLGSEKLNRQEQVDLLLVAEVLCRLARRAYGRLANLPSAGEEDAA
jgi:hypothetical protein